MGQITEQTFKFLQELQENNNKAWFETNRTRYELSHQEMIQFTEKVRKHMTAFDVLEEASGKKSLYRIYRDVRFSKDKSPYKNYWGGHFRRMGAERRGGFHFQIEPNNSHIAGGFFNPNKEDLLRIREQIAQEASPLREVLESNDFKNYFGNLTGEQVKTAPKGFDKTHADIDLLRYKQFIVQHSFTDEEVIASNFAEHLAQGFVQMLPFFEVMTSYLTTDLDGQSLI